MPTTEIAPTISDGKHHASEVHQVIYGRSALTGQVLGTYPRSEWVDLDRMLGVAASSYRELQNVGPEAIAEFLERFAERLEFRVEELCDLAHQESALPRVPRLQDVEFPRTLAQLRRAASEARSRRWTNPVLSPQTRIASMLRPIPGAVVVFGPNNFPFAFNAVSGGDAASALATGHPVISKAHPLHPGTSLLLAEQALAAAEDVPGIPRGIVQLFYDASPEAGLRLVADSRVAASAFTGSRSGGLALKQSADAAGKPIYLEMSSINPVIILPGAAKERVADLAEELATSTTMGSGQFCTKPGQVFVVGDEGKKLASSFAGVMSEAICGPVLGEAVAADVERYIDEMQGHGAIVAARGPSHKGEGHQVPATLLQVSASRWLKSPELFQHEIFGPVTTLVQCDTVDQLEECLNRIEGSLTGTIYSAFDGSDDDAYSRVSSILSERVGRLLNDKPPTGVAVVAGMNHGGPYPATGHPGFTSVGLPASMQRFGMLQCYDNVRDDRLPVELQADNPQGLQRFVETEWTTKPIVWGEA